MERNYDIFLYLISLNQGLNCVICSTSYCIKGKFTYITRKNWLNQEITIEKTHFKFSA